MIDFIAELEGVICNVIAGFLSGRVQRDLIGGVCSNDGRVFFSCVPQGSVFCPLMSLRKRLC